MTNIKCNVYLIMLCGGIIASALGNVTLQASADVTEKVSKKFCHGSPPN